MIAHLALEPNIGVLLLFGCAFCVVAFAVATWLDKRTPLVAAALWLGLVGIAHGQTPQYRSAVVSVGQQIDASSSASGVGTVVGIGSGKAYVVSCAHIFEQGQNPCWVEWPNGQKVRAMLGSIDHRYDLAALTTSQPPAGVTAIPVAGQGEHPVQGDQVEFIGHGGGVWKHVVVRVTGYTSKDNLPGATQLVTNLRPISGDSGGPFIFKGRVVGVNWGGPASEYGSAYESHGSWSGRIAKVLTQCPGGSCGIGGGTGDGWMPQAPMAPVAPQQAQTDPRLDQLILSYNATVKVVNQLAKEQGPQGPPGTPADPAELAAIKLQVQQLNLQIAALAAQQIDWTKAAGEVAKHLPPIYVNPDDKQGVKLGGTLPPFTAHVTDNGKLLPGNRGTRQVWLGTKLPLNRIPVQNK